MFARQTAYANDGDEQRKAFFKGGSAKINTLLAEGADVNHPRNNGVTPLVLAAQNGHTAVVESLLAHQANVNLPVNGDVPAFMLAAQEGHTEVVKLLLAAGGKVRVKHASGVTALTLAKTNRIRALLKTAGGK